MTVFKKTVYEFMNMFVEPYEQYFILWDLDEGEVIFKGCLENLPDELGDAEVETINNIDKNNLAGCDVVVLNVYTNV